jgi:hypothetical protein
MTIIKPVDDDVGEFLDGFISTTYLNGQCYELAIALHRGLDWELIGLVQDLYGQSVIRHAAVKHPQGGYFDGRGWLSDEEFILPLGQGGIISFTETELKHRTRSIPENAVAMAGKLAMSRWPELPWLPDTYFKKVVSFLDDLDQLCRRHGFWLCADTATSWPMIVAGDGNEIGYALATTGNGSYTTNRYLKVEQDLDKYAGRLRQFLQLPDQEEILPAMVADPTQDDNA